MNKPDDKFVTSDGLETFAAADFSPFHTATPEISADEQVIGPYRILARIGEGGMGVIYKAEQREPVRRIVALKVIKLGMDTKEVIARFEAERQALAMLSHPNVARVFEAGMTQTGRPYFAMEFVAGIPLTQYCDDSQLTTRERLELFLQVCSAVQHAHQKGIIHRDLKPTNILVMLMDNQAVPKVIDFGIAKATNQALTSRTLYTQTGAMIGTPEYMSPEQASSGGFDVDTRTDIYSLGVILYQLLTGTLPLDAKSLREAGPEGMAKIIRTSEPQKPSTRLVTVKGGGQGDTTFSPTRNFKTLHRELKGDLDWITLKAMEKDRARRYETAGALAGDIGRYLRNEPVVARPPSTAYRIQKFIRRNRLVVFAALAIVLALLAGLALATAGFIRAKKDRDIAIKSNIEEQRQKAEVLRQKIEVERQKSAAETQRKLAEESAQNAIREKENARRSLARANIALAEAAYREHDGAAMKAVLDAVPADLRNSAWHYLLEHADTSKTVLREFFCGAAADPTRPGVFAMTAGEKFRLFDASSGKTLSEFAVSDMHRRNPYRRGVAISPDGQRLAAGGLGKGGMAVYDLRTGKVLLEWEASDTDTVQFSPDGAQILQAGTGPGNFVCLWNARTGAKLWEVKGTYRAAFVPTTGNIIAARVTDQSIDLVELKAADGSVLRGFPSTRSSSFAFAVRPDGKMVATADWNGQLQGVNLDTGEIAFSARVPNQMFWFLAFTADSRRLVTVGEESQRQSIRVWSANTGIQMQALLGGSGRPEALVVHPTTSDVLVTGPVTRTWNISIPPAKAILYPYGAASFLGSDDRALLGGWSSWPTLFNIAADPPKAVWRQDLEDIDHVEASADGRVVAMSRDVAGGSSIHILVADGKVLTPARRMPTGESISFMRMSADGTRLISFVPKGRTSSIFDTATGALQTPLDFGEIVSFEDAAWLGNQRVAAVTTLHAARGDASSEERIVLWDATTGRQLRSVPHASVLNCVAAAPDGRSVAEAGVDKMIRIRDAATLELQSEFRAHDDSITVLAFHPEKAVLASASADLTIKLWDLRSGKCVEEIRGVLKPPAQLRFSPGGTRLLSASGGVIHVWEPTALRK